MTVTSLKQSISRIPCRTLHFSIIIEILGADFEWVYKCYRSINRPKMFNLG